MLMVREACQEVESRLITAINERDVSLLVEVLKEGVFLGEITSALSEEEWTWALGEIYDPKNKFDLMAPMHFKWSC